MVLIMTPSQTFALLLCTCACTWELLVAQSFNYYACADIDYQGIFQFSCSDPTKIISVTSALIGYSDKYNGQTTPVSCPWTSNTSATCNAIGFPQCSIPTPCPFPCNCTAETTLPAASCIKTNICSFGQTFLLTPQNTAFCQLSKNANFVSVNYTCTNLTTSATSQTMTSTTITTTKLTSTSSAVRSSTSTSTASVTYLPPSQSSSALSPPTVSTSTSFSVTVADSCTVQTSSHTTSTTANALSPGAIAGIAVGGAVALVLVGILSVVCFRRRKKNAEKASKTDKEAQKPAPSAHIVSLVTDISETDKHLKDATEEAQNADHDTDRVGSQHYEKLKIDNAPVQLYATVESAPSDYYEPMGEVFYHSPTRT